MTVMTESDHRRIEELAEKKFSVGRIAQLIDRHPSTVQCYMYCNGMRARKKLESKPVTYVRGDGVRVHRFTDEEDTSSSKRCGFRTSRLTRSFPAGVGARFGTERKHHSIRCRLKMLAAREITE